MLKMTGAIKGVLMSLCILVLVPFALILSFYSFWFRADSWDEVREATYLNFAIIGPIWGGIAFCGMKSHGAGFRKSIATAILTCVFFAFCHSWWTASILRVRLGPTPTEEVAKQHLSLVQAIVDYRADSGMSPYSLEDLVPAYLEEVPTANRVRWSQGELFWNHHVLYSFGKHEGWEGLSLPAVSPTRPKRSGEDLIRARLAEYDRRIARTPGDEVHYSDKVAYLLLLDRRADAAETCRIAADAVPDHWRPHLGLLALADPSHLAVAEKECHAWLAKHPAFIRYWCLARYYRDRGRHADAVAALRLAAACPLEDIKERTGVVPNAYAYDAAKYAYQQGQYELVLEITRTWSAFSYPDDSHYAFRAAAELARGRTVEARQSLNVVWPKYRQGGLWAGNLEELNRAVTNGDKMFVYNPGDFDAFERWKMFPSSEDRD